jgi:hypothetical protein
MSHSDYLLLLMLLLLFNRKHDNSTDGVGHLVLERVKESDSDCDSTKGGKKLLSTSSSDRHERAGAARAAQTLTRTTPGDMGPLATLSALLRRHLSCQQEKR